MKHGKRARDAAAAEDRPGGGPPGGGAEALDALRSLPDVSSLQGSAGQVLLYAGHFPPGLFLLLSGALRLGSAGAGSAISANGAPVVVPPLAELELPSDCDVVVSADCDLLAIPRSLALASPAVKRLLARCGARPVSLQTARPITERP